MKIYDILDDPTKKLYLYVEDVVSDYKIGDISLETAVSEIILRFYNYEKEKEEANLRRENQANL